MRALIHTFAGVAALVTVLALEPVARTGEIAILTYIALSFFLDESLEVLLRAKMLTKPEDSKRVDSLFAVLAPLHPFWEKVQLTRALGFLEEWEYKDLERIRVLRNKVAHTYEDASFADPKVIELANQLEAAQRYLKKAESRRTALKTATGSPSEPGQLERVRKSRYLFTLAASNLAGRIHGAAETFRNEEKE